MNRGKYIIATTKNPFHITVRNILDPWGHTFLGVCNDPGSLARFARSCRPDFIITDTSMNPGRLRVVLEAIDEELLCVSIIVGERANSELEGIVENSKAVFFCSIPLNGDILINTVDMALTGYKRIREMDKQLKRMTENYDKKTAVDQAKTLLMQKYGIDEQEAYKRIRTRSMDLRISMKEVAESIIDIEDMKRR